MKIKKLIELLSTHNPENTIEIVVINKKFAPHLLSLQDFMLCNNEFKTVIYANSHPSIPQGELVNNEAKVVDYLLKKHADSLRRLKSQYKPANNIKH